MHGGKRRPQVFLLWHPHVCGVQVWMRATVTNGKGTVYATGRSLFVAPRWIPDWIKSLTGRGGGKGEKQDK